MSVWESDIEFKNMFIFFLENLSCRLNVAQKALFLLQFWFIMAQLYCEVVIMNKDFIVIGQKSAQIVPILPIDYGIAWFKSNCTISFLSRIGRNKFENVLIVFGHWSITVAQRPLIFHTSKDKYTGPIFDSMNCRNCSFSHLLPIQ